MRRKKFTSKFKAKEVLAALKEQQTVRELSQKHGLAPQQINLWKREFLSRAEEVFSPGKQVKDKKTEAQEKEAQLLKTIGELKVENDF